MTTAEPKKTPGGSIEPREIVDELRQSYLSYAMSVIVSRAIPDVRDGLKPVQRRILWAMWDTGLTHSAKFKKSANVVGEVLGKYHPHGDVAVYDTMARMAQDFSLRAPLVDGQGNWGCFTKDTKVKLADGRNASFSELVEEHRQGKKNYTFAVNSAGLISIAEIKNPRLTKKNAELVRVILDNGEKIRCTPNHRFMLKDGSYKEAHYLTNGNSLMPLYEKLSTKEGRLNSDPRPVLYELNKNHKVVRVEKLAEQEDVYDLTIDKYHNFALAAGVFVHNSIDGDSPAAMRYTEARLTKVAEELLTDIEKETVDWGPNYDNSRVEPLVLPGKLPNLIVNGAVGIAVGMATSIPPHNLGEVIDAIAYLAEHGDATIEELMQFIPGPDFPTGGVIYDTRAIAEAYRTGRGAIVMRAVAVIEERTARGHQIVVTEIPYQVNKSDLVTSIAELVTEKRVEGIRDLRDESDRDGLRIVIELKSDAAPQKILNQLYKYTELQKSFHSNLLALTGGLQPEVLSLKDILAAYLDHRKLVVKRRTEFDLRKATERAHILEGLVKALDHIDRIIETIKKSKDREDAQRNLIAKFKFSELQANAILEMKLAALAALERKKLEDELTEKRNIIEELTALLKNPKKMLGLIVTELGNLKAAFPSERRTKVVPHGLTEFREEDLVPQEEAIVTLSVDGYIKRMPPDTFRAQRRGGKGLIGFDLKDEDHIRQLMAARTHDNCLFFTDRGKVFQTKVFEIPAAERAAKGKLVHNFLEVPPNEHITAMVAYGGSSSGYLTMVTQGGTIKKTPLKDFVSVRRTGIIALRLQPNDILEWAQLSSGGDEMLLVTSAGQAIRFREKDVRPMSRTAGGTRAIRLKRKDQVAGVGIIPKEAGAADRKGLRVVAVMARGFAKQTPLSDYKVQHRGGGGIKTAKVTEKTGPVIAAAIVGPETEVVLAFSKKGQALKTPLSNVRIAGRATQGVRIMNVEADDALIGVLCL
ncbi:MAG: DNA gyrase subunit A [bacterium]|nr:DNA gyrase subunit A [bacterium]